MVTNGSQIGEKAIPIDDFRLAAVVTGESAIANRHSPIPEPLAGQYLKSRAKLNRFLSLAVAVFRRSYCCRGGSF